MYILSILEHSSSGRFFQIETFCIYMRIPFIKLIYSPLYSSFLKINIKNHGTMITDHSKRILQQQKNICIEFEKILKRIKAKQLT